MKFLASLATATLLAALPGAASAQAKAERDTDQMQREQPARAQRIAAASAQWKVIVRWRHAVPAASALTLTFAAGHRPDHGSLPGLLEPHGLRVTGVFFESAQVDGVYGFDVDLGKDLSMELRRVQDELSGAQAAVGRAIARILGPAAAADAGDARIQRNRYCGIAVRGDVAAVESLRTAQPGLVLMVELTHAKRRMMPACDS